MDMLGWLLCVVFTFTLSFLFCRRDLSWPSFFRFSFRFPANSEVRILLSFELRLKDTRRSNKYLNIMSTYQLEKVHSGRATCKKCKEKITKEEIRMGVIVTANDMEMKRYLSLHQNNIILCSNESVI